MFKRRAAGQRIFPSEPAAPSMTPVPAPMTTSADLDYLHHVGNDEREAYDKSRQPPPRPTGIQPRGLYVPAVELAAVNPPIWQV